MASLETRWDPVKILKIEDLYTCVGYAPSKRRKCQNPIAYANRARASEVLDRLGGEDVLITDVKEDLEELAPLILCQRNHQGQASNMVRQWLARVQELKTLRMQQLVQRAQQQQEEQATASARRSQLQRASVRSTSPALSTSITSTTTVRTSTTVTTSHQVAIRIQQQLPTPPQTPIRRASRAGQNDDVPHLRLDSSLPTPQATPSRATPSRATSPPANAHTPEPENTPAQSEVDPSTYPAEEPPADADADAEPSPGPSTEPEPETPSSPSQQPVQQSSSSSSSSSSAHTVSIDECTICYENMPTATGIAAECGHVFHADCINRALAYQDAHAQPHTCPYCRTAWPRRPVEGDCSICCEALLPRRHFELDDGEEEEEEEDTDGDNENDTNTENTNTTEQQPPAVAVEEEQEELTWCRSLCGKNFHRGCLERWLSTSESAWSRRRCPDCRGQWV